MTFRDPKLEDVYRRNFDAAKSVVDVSQRQIIGLLAAYDLLRRMEGEQSSKVTEARELLLSSEMRPALREWYRRFGNEMNPAAIKLREYLSQLAGEKFG
jgi:hypothetical protein